MNALGLRLSVKQDRDCWWRVAINGRVLHSRRGRWNLYTTKAGALSAMRAILRDLEAPNA